VGVHFIGIHVRLICAEDATLAAKTRSVRGAKRVDLLMNILHSAIIWNTGRVIRMAHDCLPTAMRLYSCELFRDTH